MAFFRSSSFCRSSDFANGQQQACSSMPFIHWFYVILSSWPVVLIIMKKKYSVRLKHIVMEQYCKQTDSRSALNITGMDEIFFWALWGSLRFICYTAVLATSSLWLVVCPVCPLEISTKFELHSLFETQKSTVRKWSKWDQIVREWKSYRTRPTHRNSCVMRVMKNGTHWQREPWWFSAFVRTVI